MIDRKNISSLTDLLGSYRINDKGEIHFNFKGMLLKDLESYFLVYQEDNQKVL